MRRERIGDIVAIGVCTTGAAITVIAELPTGGPSWLGLVAGAAMIAAIPLRRRYPVLLTVLATLVGTVAPYAGFVVFVGVYTTAVLRRWPTALTVALFALVTSLVDLAIDVPDPDESAWVAGTISLLVAACTASGLYVGARSEVLASLRERAERAEAEQARRTEEARAAERRRIAREMHDVLGHRLSLLSVHAGALELRPDLPPEVVTRTAGVLREITRAALDDLREVLLVLREPAVDDPDGPQPRLTDLPDLVEQSRAAGMDVDLHQEVDADPPEQLGRTAYRVVQEGLTNARRHADGAPVRVAVHGAAGTGLAVEVASGPGRRGVRGSGTGLIGLGERVELVGGSLGHGTEPDGRHVLTASLPWPAP